MPVAHLTAARDLILAHFKTAWDAQTPPVPPVVYQDREQDKPDSGPWAEVSVIHIPIGDQATLGGPGGRKFRRFGTVFVRIHTPRGEGLTLADQYATIAVNAFEGTSSGDVWFRNVASVEKGRDGEWFLTEVTADFQWDVVK